MNDNIDTGAGNDVINMWGGGTDTVNGGHGSDRLSLTYAIETNDVYLNNLTQDTVNGGYFGTFNGLGGNDVNFYGIEKFTFTDRSGGNDLITTGSGRDKLSGGGGNDNLNAAGGNDTIKGGAGDDILTGANGRDRMLGGTGKDAIDGGGGADKIFGGGGNDTITGGGGNDKLTGNKGFDTFVFANGFGHDIVFGFARANQEKIDLSAVTAIVGFNDLVNHHLTTDSATGFAEIVVASNTILLNGVHQADIGAGDVYSANDFIF